MIKMCSAFLAAMFLMAGCSQYSEPKLTDRELNQKIDLELRSQIADLRAKAAATESQITGLNERLALANQRISILEADKPSLSSAYLLPGDATYRTVKTDLGPILVSLSDVQPYANGSQVRIFFGNTTSVNIHAPKAMFRWGSKPKDQPLDYTKGKSRTILFPREASVLRAGQWTSTVFQLDGVPPSELDYITVEQIDWASVTL